MKLPKFISNNLILKITSLNSLVVGGRLLISLVVQNLLAQYTGQAGIAKVGQLRNISIDAYEPHLSWNLQRRCEVCFRV